LYRYNAAQYELGEMFRRGLFTDSVELFLARKYLTLAAEQGHAEAVARLAEMDRDRLRLEEMRRDRFRDGRRCVFCGADDASECVLVLPERAVLRRGVLDRALAPRGGLRLHDGGGRGAAQGDVRADAPGEAREEEERGGRGVRRRRKADAEELGGELIKRARRSAQNNDDDGDDDDGGRVDVASFRFRGCALLRTKNETRGGMFYKKDK
jgi:hypothetical protein